MSEMTKGAKINEFKNLVELDMNIAREYFMKNNVRPFEKGEKALQDAFVSAVRDVADSYTSTSRQIPETVRQIIDRIPSENVRTVIEVAAANIGYEPAYI